MEDDTITGGEELSIDEAAAAYAKATATEVQEDQTEPEDDDEGDTTDDELQASEDEDAGDEDDGEPDDEDQAEDGGEDETDDEPDSEQGRFVADNAKVRLEDGTVTSIAELKKGSLLNADYTRKTQEVAEQRRALETQSEAFKATEKQLEEQREYVSSLLQSIVPQPPDPELLNTDPMAYMRQKADHEQWSQHQAYLDQEKQRTEQERQAKTVETERETLNREWQELVAKVPEFKEQKHVDRFARELQEHAQAYGIKPDEGKSSSSQNEYYCLNRLSVEHRFHSSQYGINSSQHHSSQSPNPEIDAKQSCHYYTSSINSYRNFSKDIGDKRKNRKHPTGF